MVKRAEILDLFKKMIRAGRGYQDYNFREYILRRTRDDFHRYQNLSDQLEI
jgi:hypothetical protein